MCIQLYRYDNCVVHLMVINTEILTENTKKIIHDGDFYININK